MDKWDFQDELAHGKEQAPWEGNAQVGIPSVALTRELCFLLIIYKVVKHWYLIRKLIVEVNECMLDRKCKQAA